MKQKMLGAGRVISLGCTDEPPFDFTIGDELPGNAPEYAAAACPALKHSPLAGKVIFWMGSSVTYGFAANGEAVADFLAKRHGLVSVKSAISGTMLADVPFGWEADNPWLARISEETPEALCREIAALSYYRRMADFDGLDAPDLFVLQLSTNDSQLVPRRLGVVEPGFDAGRFDTATTFGAMQAILARVRAQWGCPTLVYTSPLLRQERYDAMLHACRAICEKWGASLLDMNGDAAFNALGRAHMAEWMADEVHPLRRGYLQWWLPAFERAIEECL